MNTTPTPTTWADGFASHLRSLAANKAAMADLRAGLRRDPQDSLRSHRYLASFVPEDTPPGREIAVYTTASLFAHHSDLRTFDRSLGASLQALVSTGRFSTDGVEQRLQHLARSPDSRALARNLPGVVALLANAGAPLSWAHLASDLAGWDRHSAQITRRWFRDFYQDAHRSTPTAEPNDPTEEP